MTVGGGGATEPQALPLAGGGGATLHQCKGGQNASLRGDVKLNIGFSLALPASASGTAGRRRQGGTVIYLALAAQQLHRSTKEMASGAFICPRPYGT